MGIREQETGLFGRTNEARRGGDAHVLGVYWGSRGTGACHPDMWVPADLSDSDGYCGPGI